MNITCKTRYGPMIYNTKDVWVGKSFAHYGEYSEDEVNLWRAFLKPGATAIDVGANIGSLTLPLADIVGDKGMVIAFEPERINFYTLCGNVSLNSRKNIFCFQQAIGAKQDNIKVPELNEDTTNYGGLELHKEHRNVACYRVPLNTLDNIKLKSCDFIKVDVEGMELDVLKGARQTIEKFKPILYLEDDRVEKSAALHQHLEAIGYNFLTHQAALYNPDNFLGEQTNVFMFVKGDGGIVEFRSKNLICWHKSQECPVNKERFGLT